MSSWLDLVLLLADEAAPAKEAAEQAPNPLMGMLLPMLGIGLLFYFLLLRPQQKDQQRRQEALSQLKKNDKVVTIGGIVGTYVSGDDRFIVIEVDKNTRLKMLRSAIQRKLEDDAPADSTPEINGETTKA